LDVEEESPPPPYPPPPPPPPPTETQANLSDAQQIGRKGGLQLTTEASTFHITPGGAIILWLVLVGVFLMLLPRIFRNKRARREVRSD
jgi:hypothetical protein